MQQRLTRLKIGWPETAEHDGNHYIFGKAADQIKVPKKLGSWALRSEGMWESPRVDAMRSVREWRLSMV